MEDCGKHLYMQQILCIVFCIDFVRYMFLDHCKLFSLHNSNLIWYWTMIKRMKIEKMFHFQYRYLYYYLELNVVKILSKLTSCWRNKRKCQYANFFYESFYKQRLLILLSGELSVTINEGIVNLIEVYLWREIYTTWYNYLCIANVAYHFDMIIVSFNKKKVNYDLNISFLDTKCFYESFTNHKQITFKQIL